MPSIIIIQRQPRRPAMPSMWPMLREGGLVVGVGIVDWKRFLQTYP